MILSENCRVQLHDLWNLAIKVDTKNKVKAKSKIRAEPKIELAFTLD